MVHDPHGNRRRPRPDRAGPAPVDALLGDRTANGEVDGSDRADEVVEALSTDPPDSRLSHRAAHHDPLAVGENANEESGGVDEPQLPPQPSVTPTPADPWTDRQIYSTATISTAVGAGAALILLRWLWRRRKRR